MRIYVTARDIERGRKNSHTYHPIARAIWHRVTDGTLVQLVHEQVMLCGHGIRLWLDLPLSAVLFARAFNDAANVTPISFALAIPNAVMRKRSAPPRDSTAFPFYDPPQLMETVDYRT